MSDSNTTAQADTGTEAQNLPSGMDSANGESSTTTNAAPQDKAFTQADINRIVAKAEKDAVAKALKANADKVAEAELTASEREKQRAEAAETRAEAAEQRAQAIMVRNAVTIAFADPNLKARDPKALAMLVNAESLEVDGDDVKGIEAEVKRLRSAHPALFYSSTADGGAQGSGSVDVKPGLGRLAYAYEKNSRK